MAQCLLGLGSNLGDRKATLDGACEQLDQASGVRLVARSRWITTQPVGGPEGQAEFLNGVAIVETTLAPSQLLKVTQKIEAAFGRERTEHWGPRTLDIDLLLFGDKIFDTPDLRIPHPLMSKRTFVLEPAVEIAGDWIHPERNATLAGLLADLSQKPTDGVE